MLKATAGGGGIGMRVCDGPEDLAAAFGAVQHLAAGHFGDGGVFLERYVARGRHVEVQVFGDGRGSVLSLGERDCSLQRRHQKVIEETPAPGLSDRTRDRLIASAVRLMSSVAYRSAGTVEFLYDPERDEFFFLEVNTRLQVEHGITEQVYRVDLVEWMVRLAAGEDAFLEPHLAAPPEPRGASIEVRLYAEDPADDFRPAAGTLTAVAFPARGTRVETWVETGSEVTPHYDPLLAKLIVEGADRGAAVHALQTALGQTRLEGIRTNLSWLQRIVESDFFVRGVLSTNSLSTLSEAASGVRVVSGGLATTVQDYPGRLGYWSVGVPPSGPMDALAFRLGNRLLGNQEGAVGLEWTASGPTLQFRQEATLCLTGAASDATLDGAPVTPYTAVTVRAGQTLRIGRTQGAGLRGYILVRGGIAVDRYLGSGATFTLGGFGGHAGRSLAAGDVLALGSPSHDPVVLPYLPQSLRPELSREWTIRVLYGPHAAPDFFTEEDVRSILGAAWRVHHNSNRTGVRLVGPRPRWARRDGGEAGLHPSNIHDNPYAVGAVDFTGDMPIILGPDGPSLGGFVCPVVTIQADLWKLGQLAPGDLIRFDCIEPEEAHDAEREQDARIERIGRGHMRLNRDRARELSVHPAGAAPSAVVGTIPASSSRPETVYRRQGDRNLLIEYGPLVLDLELRLRVHALMLELERLELPGVIDVTPGIRSLQVHYDPRVLGLSRLLERLADAEECLGTLEQFEIPSRVVNLPLSFEDPSIAETIARYLSSVRASAPWCPDNIEFIRRVNGLESREDVRRIVFDARYLVLGLGDVYLGAPVATPLDPRHRLVTTKYNPARTWTPPNVVGIGGAYLCIYGMEGPGGYQLFGRTIQVWNSHRPTRDFRAGTPWLLRFFDQIRFFPVSHAELTEWRRDFPCGRRDLQVESERFRLADYRRYLIEHHDAITAFQDRRRAAFEAERQEWARGELTHSNEADDPSLVQQRIELPHDAEIVEAPLGGNVWRIYVKPGQHIEKGTAIAAIEAMKTECSVPSPASGIVRAVYIVERQTISPGAPMAAIQSGVVRSSGNA
jgi:urea carboxylase